MVYVFAITFLGSTRRNHQRPGRVPFSTPLLLFWLAVVTVVFVSVISHKRKGGPVGPPT